MSKFVNRRVSMRDGDAGVEMDDHMSRNLEKDGAPSLSRTASVVRQHTIHQCARSGNVDGLRRLLRDKEVVSRVNDLDEQGMSALHYAARGSFFDCVTTLLKKGNADTMVRDEEQATPLHYVARKLKTKQCDDTVKIIDLLSRTADVNARDNYWSTPLHVAAMRGNVVAANALLNCGGTLVNAKDHLGCTALHEAATYNHSPIVNLLIEHGARMLMTDNEKSTALHLACNEGVTDIVRILLQKCEEDSREQLIAAKDKDDCSALHYAIESQVLGIVEMLLKYGADVNARCRLSTSGATPLHLAAVAGDSEIINLLLQRGARVNSRNLKDATPLHVAAEFDCVNITKILIKNVSVPVEARDISGYTPLQTAVAYGSTEIVQLLLAEGAVVDVIDNDEKSTVYQAVEYDHLNILKILLREAKKSGLHFLVNTVDVDGNAPIHVAARRGDVSMIKALLKYGADLGVKNECEETPFICAAQDGQLDVIKLMLEKTEKVITDEDEYSNTPLHHASANGHLDVVKYLAEWGADKEARNNRSRCPLDLAAGSGHVNVVKFLLDEDVSPNPIDKQNVTPLHLASQNGHDAAVVVLIERGADVAAVDVEGNNCLDIAIDNGHKHVAAAILDSKSWHIALANETRHSRGKPRNTPLRKLIMKMPDISRMAFTKCVSMGPEGSKLTDENRYCEFNYDYIDDTYTDYQKLAKHHSVPTLAEKTLPPIDQMEYTFDNNWLKKNHPLMIAMSTENDCLVSHPLVLACIRHKWAAARPFYFLYNIFYMLYLAILTAYLLSSPKPYDVDDDDGEEFIVKMNDGNETCPDGWVQSNFEINSKYIVWVLAGIGLLIEVIQACFQRWIYVSYINLLDWFSYVSAIILVVDIADCGMRTEWQWQMGAFTLLVTWFNLILYLRRLPGLGIYVVMIVEIFSTFAKFFVAFLLFIIAFAMSFHLLVANQGSLSTPFYSIIRSIILMIGEFDFRETFFPDEPAEQIIYEGSTYAIFIIFVILVSIIVMNLLDSFSTPFYSIIRTTVMMIGEFDFEDTFHIDEEEEEILYEGVTYTIFLIFCFVVAIIIMNLLVGLAVDDVNGLRERAKVVKLKMQIDFALDTELALPYSWKRKLGTTIRRDRILPNIDWGTFWRAVEKLQNVVEGPLMSQEVVVAGVEELVSASNLPDIIELENRLVSKIKRNRTELQTVNAKLDRIQRMLEAMAPQRAGRITPVQTFTPTSDSDAE